MSTDELCIHHRSTPTWRTRKWIAVLLMHGHCRARLKVAVVVWPAYTLTICVFDW
jgi:hypothetical protein